METQEKVFSTSLKAYFPSTTALMNRLTFFQLDLNYSNATAAVVLRVLRSVHVLYSVIAVPPPPPTPRPRLSPFDREDRKGECFE